MQYLKLALPLILVFLLSGCEDELKPSKSTDNLIYKLSSASVLIAVEGRNANEYQVTFTWPKASGTLRISESGKVLAVLPGAQEKFIHQWVEGGTEQRYLIEHISEGLITSSLPINVGIPKDLEISGKVDLTDHLSLNSERVFLDKDAVITTYDFDLSIYAKELISDGAIIQSFPEDAQAKVELNGKAGGAIRLFPLKASGSLQVYLRGENGGNGKNGQWTNPSHGGCRGTSGGNGGNAGSLTVMSDDAQELSLTYENKEGQKGKAGKRGVGLRSNPAEEIVEPPCNKDDPDGVDGKNGLKGQVCLKLTSKVDYVCFKN